MEGEGLVLWPQLGQPESSPSSRTPKDHPLQVSTSVQFAESWPKAGPSPHRGYAPCSPQSSGETLHRLERKEMPNHRQVNGSTRSWLTTPGE